MIAFEGEFELNQFDGSEYFLRRIERNFWRGHGVNFEDLGHLFDNLLSSDE